MDRTVVDVERLDRLLSRVADDIAVLTGFHARRDSLFSDQIALAALKYYFITAIEGCAKVAQHIIAAQGWPVAESNADAIRRLGSHEVLKLPAAEAVARAVGFRNILVHEYAETDDRRVIAQLDRLPELEAFVTAVAQWLTKQR